jgi:hypothetical protein
MSEVENRTLNSMDVSVGGHTLLFQGAEAVGPPPYLMSKLFVLMSHNL